MQIATLEHVNITVSDSSKTAAMLCRIFGWHIRWEGSSMDEGYTVHVGTENSYLALYSNARMSAPKTESYLTRNSLNHIALVVEDLDAAEQRVKIEGLKTHNHGDYEPGRRFYFHDEDGVEYEVVSYVTQKEAFRRDIGREMGTMAKAGALMR